MMYLLSSPLYIFQQQVWSCRSTPYLYLLIKGSTLRGQVGGTIGRCPAGGVPSIAASRVAEYHLYSHFAKIRSHPLLTLRKLTEFYPSPVSSVYLEIFHQWRSTQP